MTALQALLIFLISFMVVAVLFKMPVSFALGTSSLLVLAFGGYNLVTVPQFAFSGLDSFALLAIPFYIFAGVSGYFNGLIMAAVYACMLDTIEVGQYKNGIRASAFAVSLCHFANKLGMTISTAGVGAVLAALGFAANQTQNGDVLFWINGFFTWVPGVIGIVVGVVFLFYKLNRERYYEILAKLKEKAE